MRNTDEHRVGDRLADGLQAVRFTRLVVIVVGLSFVAAERLGGLAAPYVFAGVLADQAPLLWNTIFLTAGATTVVWGVTLAPLAGKLSLVALVATTSSRALALALLVPDPPVVPVAVYVAFTALVLWSWPRAMAELDVVLSAQVEGQSRWRDKLTRQLRDGRALVDRRRGPKDRRNV